MGKNPKGVYCFVFQYLASLAMQEIAKRNNIFNIWRNDKYFFSFAYVSAVWLLFGQNPNKIIVDTCFLLDFAQIVTKQLIDKQN